MKKLLLSILLFFPLVFFAQDWMEYLPKDKAKQELTFYDYQTAFRTFEQETGVIKGKRLVNGEMVKVPGWKQFKRWEWNMEGQIDSKSGKFPEYTAQQVYNQFKIKNSTKVVDDFANWTNIGPNSSYGGYAGIGRVNCIAFHPTDNNTYWVGAPAGGLWVTMDNGSSWICLTDDNNVLGVSDIIIPSDYATSNTIYIATGDRDAFDNNSVGVLKSTDNGVTWNETALNYSVAQGKMVSRLLIDPNDDNTIIAATSDGVYKTIDGGATWSDQLTSNVYIDMEYKSGDFNTLYGSTEYGRVYYSSNGGSTWFEGLYSSGGRRIELAVSAADPSVVYALVANSGGGLSSIQKSTNSASSFTQVLSGSSTNLLGWYSDAHDSGGQGWYDLSIAVSPTNADDLIVGGVNSHRSSDGGDTWSCSNCWTSYYVYNLGNHPVAHADKHNHTYRSNGDLFECNDGGIYLSTNDGLTWTDKSNGLVISQMYKLGVAQTLSGEVITGLQDNGTKLVSNNYWRDVKGGDGMECLIDYTDKNIQYGTYTNGQISRTTNHWSSSSEIQPAAAGDGAWVTPYIIDPTDHNTLYAGYANVYKTTDKGNNWTKISAMNSSDKLRSMAIAPSNVNVIYVADNSSLWATTNGGSTWAKISGGIPATSVSNITYIAVKNDDENTIWVTLSGYNNTAVYESTNGGATWSNISAGLPELPAYSIVQNKQITDEVHLYVATELGIYLKVGSDDWVEFNTGLPNVRIGEVEIYYDETNPENSELYTATYGRGLWKSNVFFSIAAAPVVDFESSEIEIVEGQSIVFSDLSENEPTSWAWTFEAGTPETSTEQNPEVLFNTPGIYDVTLSASNELGSDSETKSDFISVTAAVAPMAGFIVSNTTVFVGQNIQLTDTSENTPISWVWTLAGSAISSSTEQNPVVYYTAAGTYDVSLTVTNNAGTDTETKNALITVVELPEFPPVTNFSAAVINTNDVILNWDLPYGSIPDTYSVFRNNTLQITISDATQTSYLDADLDAGLFNYYIIANYANPIGTSIESNHNSVEIIAQPVAAFYAYPVTGSFPLNTNFYNNSTDAVSYIWDFGDGSTSSDKNPSHTYDERGTYTVSLTSINDYGSDTETIAGYITVTDEEIVANFSASPLFGELPLEVVFTNTTTGATDYLWNFGDESTSTEENPTHTFETAGIFSISLTASNLDFEKTKSKNNYISVDPVNIPENWKERLSIFPNPANDFVNVNILNVKFESTSIELFDLQGKLINTINPEVAEVIEKQVDVTQLQRGSYFLKITIGDEMLLVKIAVE
ncbi:MAG: PKD domain-containing protein [Salinivirgaceae bacterium]|nr:PKD domain-containing protein [Salinivirgaceae bacterium]